MVIRKAERKDASAIGLCHYHCWQETYCGLISDEYLDSKTEEESMRRFETIFDTRGKFMYVLEEENQIIGLFDIGEPRDEHPYAPYEMGCLYLRKAYQGLGYGRAVMAFIREQIAGSQFYLWCLKTNPTIGYYAHMGGKQVSEKNVNIGGRVETEVCFLFG